MINRSENLQTVCFKFNICADFSHPNGLLCYFSTFLAFYTSFCQPSLFELSAYSFCLYIVAAAEGDKAPDKASIQLRLVLVWVKHVPFPPAFCLPWHENSSYCTALSQQVQKHYQYDNKGFIITLYCYHLVLTECRTFRWISFFFPYPLMSDSSTNI